MKIDILTLFPEHVNAMLHESILGRACKKGILDINCVQIRDYTENRQNQVDDYPESLSECSSTGCRKTPQEGDLSFPSGETLQPGNRTAPSAGV